MHKLALATSQQKSDANAQEDYMARMLRRLVIATTEACIADFDVTSQIALEDALEDARCALANYSPKHGGRTTSILSDAG